MGASITGIAMSDRNTAPFLRARSPEQRETRRQAILQAAERLLDAHAVSDISLRELARSAGLSKTNVTRYFDTREAVFFALLNERFASWIAELAASAPGATNDLAADVSESLARQPALCKLWASLGAELERNIPASAIVAFKTAHTERQIALAAWVMSCEPALTEGQAREWVQMLILLVAGLWPFAQPAAAVQEALTDPALASSRVDFRQRLERTLSIALRGILSAPPA